jgi:hypothetical protein
MVAIVSLLLVISISILVTRVASVALTHTGLSTDAARFQARSAFTGVGFTTSESEQVVNHPVRRRILMLLMLLGNAGIVTAVSTLILTFVNVGSTGPIALRIVLLVTGIVVLWGVASSRWVDQHLSQLISWALKRYTNLPVHDYVGLLHLADGHTVTEFKVGTRDWLANKTIRESRLRDEGILLLGITRPDGTYIGGADGPTTIQADDILILYGRESCLENLFKRRKGKRGDMQHKKAVAEQKQVVRETKKKDPVEKEDK